MLTNGIVSFEHLGPALLNKSSEKVTDTVKQSAFVDHFVYLPDRKR